MSIEEENKVIVRRAIDLINTDKQDELIYELITSDYIEHYGEHDVFLDDIKKSIDTKSTTFWDAVGSIKDMVAEGDKVAYRITWMVTQADEYMDVSQTGKKTRISYPAIYRIENNKLAEWWGPGDILVQQLGAIPSQQEG